jgi:hypothetical protein
MINLFFAYFGKLKSGVQNGNNNFGTSTMTSLGLIKHAEAKKKLLGAILLHFFWRILVN